ncbi:MAG TPA: acyl-CoA dehydrogenase family protein [Syntrophorhabdaceae bacterium]|jgi:alkylation response protein AidB-like acyl-CoA dehydrogenase
MESFTWWTDEQIKFAEEVEDFVASVMPRDAETRWTREFPWDIFEKIGKKKYAGAAVPKEYGGLGLGCTGACIVAEAFGPMPGINRALGSNMLGGLHQFLGHGTEEQKRKYLPRLVNGEMGAIVITEPVAGTDASAMTMEARREGDVYILNGKKRFVSSAGVATRHIVYGRTSNDPEVIRKHRHLTAFVIEKGVKGFTVEKINEIIAFKNVQNGVLDFDNVAVSVADRIGDEGDGWAVMTGGLNFERTLISAQAMGLLGELVRGAVPYTERRVQFGSPTIDLATNQFKIADLVIRMRTTRVLTYHTAYMWDIGKDTTIDSNLVKVFNLDAAMAGSLDAIQLVGGDGTTAFYPLEDIMKTAKVDSIAGGSMEACRLVIFRNAMKRMKDEMKMRRREPHPEMGVPIPVYGPQIKEKNVTAERLLGFLAEDYRVNPGLFMSREDIQDAFEIDDPALDALLISMEKSGLVWLNKTKKGIQLAKASYEGLKKANPPEHYQWFPEWIDRGRDRVF